MQSPFIHTVILVVWSGFCFSLGHSIEPWSLRVSDSNDRNGRFLNVPIFYGDWVPITKARQTIEAVASKIEAATNPHRRKDPPPQIITADRPEDRLDTVQLQPQHVPYDPTSHHHHHHQRQQWSQKQRGHNRQQQWSRGRDRNRGHRKLPPPAPFVNSFSWPQVTTQKPEEITTAASSSSGILGSVFNFFNPLISQHKPDIILHDTPVIKTLPAPDLTKV